jgi:hypothetical protein
MSTQSAAQSGSGGRVRTSDAEREQVAAILRAAVTEGRLNLEEGDQRLAQTYEAKYRDQLAPLTADLPSGGWEGLAQTPEVLATIRRRLRRHGAVVVVGAGVLIGLWALSGAHFFWPLIPLFVLFFSFARHARFARYRAMWGAGPWGPGRGPWGRGPGGHGGWGGPGWGAR